MVLDSMGQTRNRDHTEKRISVPELALKVLKLPGVNIKLDKPKSRQPSKQLQQVVTKIGSTFMTLEDNINEALELGRKEGFTDMEVGDMIRAEFKRINRPRMTLSRYLPATAKHMEKARPKSDFGNRMLPNKPVATTTSRILPSTNTTHPADTTQLEQQGMLGKFNQAPDEYEIDKLDEYDTEYLREIVKDLHVKARKVKKMTDKALAIMKSPDDYVPPPFPGEEVHWKHPTEIHFMIKEDIDKYNESTCKQVLKEALHKYLDLLGLHNRLRISKKSYDQKYNDLRELRYKYKVCCLCNTNGAHRISEKEWYCSKHKAENDKLNREMGPMLSNLIVASAKMEAEEKERVV